tara:strand:- start:2727 stop:3176 length:450 start_codon:yes stop_codon:yes gene_type:complete
MPRQPDDEVEILLVEDNPGDIILAQEGFKMSKIVNRLHVCENGESALAFLRREGEYADVPRPHLVLLDLNLPKMSGHDVLQAIKEDEALCEIPVIILTSSSAERDVRMSFRQHANSYIVKPDDIARLTEIVEATEAFWFGVAKSPRRIT